MREVAAAAVGKRERTRRHIYKCAFRLFREKGYAATTVGDICAEAAVSRATFFIHFSEKAALVGEASLQLGEVWESKDRALGAVPAAERLRHFVEFLFDNMVAPEISAPMLDDFRKAFGGNMSPGTGIGTLHHHASLIIAQAQREGSVTSLATPDVLAHHAIRLVSLYRIFTLGSHDETKALLWRLFYSGAGTTAGN
ncbi:TetR/AcrR family transcriptional regulator [Sphingobium indicum]|uniref:TetR/AcrR family transcriptional regulator n=1 Tax=Sphingobium indicum TaxID=332055 RepID=UPI00185BB628|nr:TetR/AcrR family transcriptional regulator [Sphingobium indicum]NYI23614.1 AcrR family transcriptional regulator [Sphingobium indicum]